LIFLEQPHIDLLTRHRFFLSHDKKESLQKINNKTQKHGLKAINDLLKGFLSVFFCIAGLKIDEQEATRFILLSPETSQKKIRETIHEKIMNESDSE
jgi:hypothetical protein